MGTTSETKRVSWQRCDPAERNSPLVRELPYVEVKLEHPQLEPTGQIDRFFPAAVPYGGGDTDRVFFWEPVLDPAAAEPTAWTAACATVHDISGIVEVPASVPSLVVDESDGDAVDIVVTGTIVGDAEIARVRSYHPPSVRVTHVSADEVAVSVAGDHQAVARGTRCRIELPDQRITPVDDDSSRHVSPELTVRYPGIRELHHPAVGTADRLFPTFGLDLDQVTNPVTVPTHNGELDHDKLAERLGVDRSERPYAERVLWQAFAYSAFDPHRESTPALGQDADGHLILLGNG